MNTKTSHIPVLVEEVLALFQPKRGDILLDATIGHGGHARAFLESAQDSRVVGLDADAHALDEAKRNLAQFGKRVTYVHGSYSQVEQHMQQLGYARFTPVLEGPRLQSGNKWFQKGPSVRGIASKDATDLSTWRLTHVLFDLGMGSHQLEDMARGFSFQSRGPLIMMYGDVSYLPKSHIDALNALEKKLGGYPDARDLIIHLRVEELALLLRMYGEERNAMKIARSIKSALPPPESAQELAGMILRTAPASRRKKIHPATKTFQALRIAVNRELESLEATLPQAVSLLELGGKIGVISFHSLEDRIVKQYFRQQAKDCICPPTQIPCVCGHRAQIKVLTKKPVTAGEKEKIANPRSRSAKLRVAQKVTEK